MPWVTLRVPASSANLGPGFDALGLALGIYLECRFRESPQLVIRVSGRDAAAISTDEDNLIWQTALAVARDVRESLPPVELEIDNQIPIGKGLGSSAAALTAGVVMADRLLGLGWKPLRILDEAARIEGHPDNVAACVHGGLTACVLEGGIPRAHGLLLHHVFSTVVAVPDFELTTKRGRAVLPKRVPLADAVHNLSRTALLVRALETGRSRELAVLMEDRLHQPYRARLVPGLRDALTAAVRAGAAGAALSGSGPAVFALVDGSAGRAVGEAMRRAFAARGVRARALELAVDRLGVRVER
jgi:homoserine kinase